MLAAYEALPDAQRDEALVVVLEDVVGAPGEAQRSAQEQAVGGVPRLLHVAVPEPLEEGPVALDRLRAAFHETGRGLLVGVGLTCAAQGLVAMIAYLALGVPLIVAFLLAATVAIGGGLGAGLAFRRRGQTDED